MQRPSGAVEHNPLHEKKYFADGGNVCVVVWVCEAQVAVGCPREQGKLISLRHWLDSSGERSECRTSWPRPQPCDVPYSYRCRHDPSSGAAHAP